MDVVSGWALIAACFFFFGDTVDYMMLYVFQVHCHPSSIVLRCVDLTDEDAIEDEAILWGLTLCFAALQAAAAVLALLLPSRHRRLRRKIELVALGVTVSGHCSYGILVGRVFAANKGYVFYLISRTAFIVVLAVGDMVCYCICIVGGEEQQQAEAAGQDQGQQQLPN